MEVAWLRAGGAPQAIREFSKVGKPIYITETGIADAKDTLRAEWAESYFRAVGCLCSSGFPACLPHVLHACTACGPHIQPASNRTRWPKPIACGGVHAC